MANEPQEHIYSRGPASQQSQAERERGVPADPPVGTTAKPNPGLPPSGMTVAQEQSIRDSAVRDEAVKAQGLAKELLDCLTRLTERLQH